MYIAVPPGNVLKSWKDIEDPVLTEGVSQDAGS